MGKEAYAAMTRSLALRLEACYYSLIIDAFNILCLTLTGLVRV